MKLSLIKFVGGKYLLSSWLLNLFPKNYNKLKYIEPCLGGGNLLLSKKPSKIEVGNDIDYNIYCVWKSIQNKSLYRVSNLPYSENIFNFYKKMILTNKNSVVSIAEREYVLRNMSRGGLGKDFSESSRLRGGQNEGKNAWENKLKMLPNIHNRVKNVKFYNLDIIDCLKLYNKSDSFTYIDVPYVHSTRSCKKLYKYEMTDQQHMDLLDYLTNEWAGTFLISNYMNPIYDSMLKRYNAYFKLTKNHSGQTKKKSSRVEVAWTNY